MKRFLLLFLGSLLWTASEAGPVSESEARAKALRFFQRHGQTRLTGPTLQLEWNGESASTRSDNVPAYYVYNRTDLPGFVIVAGDDLVPTILGYSDEHPFQSKQMPDNLRSWMENLRQQILQVRSSAFCTSTRADNEVGEVVLKHETAQWDQSAPFNNECPVVNGEHAATGCTATAFAIAIRSRRWPDQGVGTIPSYTSKGDVTITVAARPMEKPYQWDLMPLTLTLASSDEEKAQVARLMADCGAMGKSLYGSETGAYVCDMLGGAIEYMKYDAAAVPCQRNIYSDERWMEMLKGELQENGPVIYSGYTKKQEGHAFILDGYTSNNYFSLNWGWGGLANGYYLIDNLTPTAQGIGGANSANGFNYGQSAIIGFKKSTGASKALSQLMLAAGQSNDGAVLKGLSTLTSKVEKDMMFSVKAGVIMSYGTVPFVGEVALAHFDIDDKSLGVVSDVLSAADSPISGGEGFYINSWPCRVTQEPQPGDYIALVYKRSSEEAWQPLPWDKTVVGHLELRSVPSDIEANTSITYDRKSRTATVKTLADVTWQVTTEDHSELIGTGTTTEENPTFRIETAQLPSGNYVLTMKKQKTVVSITLKVKGTSK